VSYYELTQYRAIIAYIRTSTDKQDLNNQKLEILEFARKKELKIDKFVEITMSSRKTSKQQQVDEVGERLEGADTLVVAELKRNLISLRAKEALKAKKLQGVTLGKSKGAIQKSQFDEHRERIQELLGLGLSVRKIAKLLGYNSHLALNTYVKKRGLRASV
jgi:DNA invertase Pin-like site-specific DNA recombinase